MREPEWLARDDYRIVFESKATNPFLVSQPEDVAQYGVHIFSDTGVPFKELDCVPNKYSPALHCVPSDVVGGFTFPSSDEDEYFILYDFKDYYHTEIGLSLPATNIQIGLNEIQDECAILEVLNPGQFPAKDLIATSTPVPSSNLPFDPQRTWVGPIDVWSISVASFRQIFPDSEGFPCSDIPEGFTFCEGEGSCHGTFANSPSVGYGTSGLATSVGIGQRTVVENHPCRNRLFVQGVFEVGSVYVDKAYSVFLSEEGSSNFGGVTYEIFSGNSADIIALAPQYDIGGVNFNSALPPGSDPNPPSDGTNFYRSFFNDFTEECGCVNTDPGTIDNKGRVDTRMIPGFDNGQFGFSQPQIDCTRNLGIVPDSFISYGTPSILFA